MVAVLLVLAFTTVGTHAEPERSSSPQPCVALLEPEYVSHDYETTGDALIGWLDMQLTESLSAREDFTMVSRQAMDELLAEKERRKLNPETACEELRPFLSAGVLVCPKIVVQNKKTGRAVLTVQAVLAQTGALLAEIIVDLQPVEDGWKTSPELGESLKGFWPDMRRNLRVHLGTRTFEVTGIHLKSKLERLQWMATFAMVSVTSITFLL